MKLTKKKILFISGTRADFGKIKSLLYGVKNSKNLDYSIFITGAHLLKRYDYTYNEIIKSGFNNLHLFKNHSKKKKLTMDEILAKTILGLSDFIKNNKHDMIVVHGDRPESLAGAIVGSFSNVIVSHIEGGELSGTIDELIRHAVTKLSHCHFVSNKSAKNRLIQLGEKKSKIHIIGSPDFDIMNKKNLPSLNEVQVKYNIKYNDYFIFLYHPVITEIKNLNKNIKEIINALILSKKKYVVIYPNNDHGSEIILKNFNRIKNNINFKIFPSIQFESFLSLMKYSKGIIGNSSAGIIEAPFYGIPTINIGSRQDRRFDYASIKNINENTKKILNEISKIKNITYNPTKHFGRGQSTTFFLKAINKKEFWNTDLQKKFQTIIHNKI